MTGIAGLDFVNDMVSVLGTKWKTSGGKKPQIDKQWEIKAVGVGKRIYDQVIIGLDSETANIFSLQYTDDNNNPKWDWLHDISLTIDIRSSVSEVRVLELVDEVMRIIKENVLLNINNRNYVRIVPNGITSVNEEYRNLFRYILSCDAIFFNP